MKDLVEHIVKAIVDNPADVQVTEVVTGADVLLELRVAPTDMGRVIGKQGKVISAMRLLVQVVATHEARRAQLEVVED